MKHTISITLEADAEKNHVEVNVFYENDTDVKSSSFKVRTFRDAIDFIMSYFAPMQFIENILHKDAAEFDKKNTKVIPL